MSTDSSKLINSVARADGHFLLVDHIFSVTQESRKSNERRKGVIGVL